MARSPFLIGISDLSTPGDQRSEHLEASVDWSVGLNRVLPDPPLVAELTVTRISGGVTIHGTVTATVASICRRCLDEFVDEHEIRVSVLYLEEEDDDAYELTGDELDIEQMLRDEVLLDLPAAPSCGPDCAGVVSTSQPDLNTLSEGEPEEPPGSPFDVLRGFFDPDS